MFKNFFFMILFATVGLASQVYAQDSDVAGVTAATEKLRALMVDPKKADLDALVHSDLSYGHSSGKIDTKDSFIGDLISGASDFASAQITEQTVKIVGNVAIVRHIFTAKQNKGGKVLDVKLRNLLIWQKQQDGMWKLIARQAVKF